MAIYEQLLAKCGGGIIAERQKEDQADCATICIGLGGTGVSCLRTLKQEVYSRVKADDPDAPDPKYRHIKFLAIDSDDVSINGGPFMRLDPDDEFERLSCENFMAFLGGKKLWEQRPEFRWFSREFDWLDTYMGMGTCGVRQIGRLLLILNSERIKAKIQSMIFHAIQDMPPRSAVNIHIFSGMCGGTGSGIFLDVCYIVRQVIAEFGLSGRARILGFCFMPDVNISYPTVMSNEMWSGLLKSNGYAAMKELDHCMGFEHNGGCWDQDYGIFHIGPTREAPVDACHLVGAKTVDGVLLPNGYDCAINAVRDFVMQFIVKGSMPLDAHLANTAVAMSRVPRRHGANYDYRIIGSANAVVPLREINTYLAGSLFSRFEDCRNNVPSSEQIKEFADKNGIGFDKLFRRVMEGTSLSMPHPDLDWHDYRNMAPDTDMATYTLPDEMLDHFRRAEGDILEKADENICRLTGNGASVFELISSDSASVTAQIFNSLVSVACDRGRGPYFAAGLLRGNYMTGVVEFLAGIRHDTETAMVQAHGHMMRLTGEIKQKKMQFLNMGLFGNRKNAFEELIEAVGMSFSDDCRIKALEKLKRVTEKLIDQFNELYDTFFKPYAVVCDDLTDTFRENMMHLNSDPADAEAFDLPLISLSDVKGALDGTVAAMDLNTEFSDFHRSLLRAPGVWLERDERRISAYISKYFSEKFSNYAGRTVTDYLRIRFKTADPVQLSRQIYDSILAPLSIRAVPLFWSGRYNIAENAVSFGYCAVPYGADAADAAAGRLTAERRELTMVNVSCSDRISVLCMSLGVPMFAFNCTEEYMRSYESHYCCGRHLYEETDGRDWRRLSDIIPYSAYEDPDEWMRKDAADYDRAAMLGIIHEEWGNDRYYVMDITPDPAEKIASYDAMLKAELPCTIEELDNMIAEIGSARNEFAEYVEAMEPISSRFIRNNGAPAYREIVRRDNVLGSYVLMSTLREELAKADAVSELMARFDDRIEEIKARKDYIETVYTDRCRFYTAVLAGIIEFELPKVTLIKTNGAETEKIVLSSPVMQPYGIKIPLYQGFLSYLKLDGNEKNEIEEESNRRYSENVPEMISALKALREQFSDKYIKVLELQVKGTVDSDLITDFINGFKDQLDVTCMMFGV